jgi:hypothetical protein
MKQVKIKFKYLLNLGPLISMSGTNSSINSFIRERLAKQGRHLNKSQFKKLRNCAKNALMESDDKGRMTYIKVINEVNGVKQVL